MSRTHKTDPFYVKVRRHHVESHDHSRLGREVWRTRNVRDENGERIVEPFTFYHTAASIIRAEKYYFSYLVKLDENGTSFYGWQFKETVTLTRKEKLLREAREAVSQGDPDRMIVGGTAERYKTERYLHHTIPNHCTIEEAKAEKVPHWRSDLPCTLEADWNGAPDIYRCNCSMCRGGYEAENARRRASRDSLRSAVKLANSGYEDWEDDWNDLPNTTPNRYSGRW